MRILSRSQDSYFRFTKVRFAGRFVRGLSG